MVGGEEEVVAFVQLHPNLQISTDDLAKYAAQKLAAYKQPTQIVLVADMPVTSLGKVIKDQLLSRLNGGYSPK
jgi:acyl-CoA synthetase (AMP-forming)/AMP-acid ligase II